MLVVAAIIGVLSLVLAFIVLDVAIRNVSVICNIYTGTSLNRIDGVEVLERSAIDRRTEGRLREADPSTYADIAIGVTPARPSARHTSLLVQLRRRRPTRMSTAFGLSQKCTSLNFLDHTTRKLV